MRESNYYVVNLSRFTTPEIVEVRNKEWIEYGADNNHFQYLIDRYTGSTTNNAIINGIANQIYGKGINAKDSSRRPEAYAQMLSLFSKEDLRRFIKDRKMLGMAAFQVSYQKNIIVKVSHFPMNTLRAGKKNKDGDIEKWFYHPKWIDKKPSEIPKEINAFGFGNKKGNEMLVLQPYAAGFEYYSPVDFVAALPYCVLEEEIADYLINDTINGFSGTKVINFNNGIPDEKKRLEIKRDVINKLTGARGEKVIIAFNSNQESATTVTDLPLNDAPAHYDYLSKECRDKLIVAHKVTSPMLIGVRESGGGLGNNADEIKTASILFDSITIDHYRNEITDVMDMILEVNDISLDLFFNTLQPLGMDGISVQMSKVEDFSDEFGNLMLDNLLVGNLDDEWELVDKREYSEDNESIEDWANKLITSKISLLARIIKSAPSKKSRLDKDMFKVRYKYSQKYSSGKSRDFCIQMMSRTSNGVVYRLEDIQQASFQGVNKSFGHKGRNYSLFRFKGGVNCGHYWTENLYRLKTKTDGTPFVDKALSSSQKVDKISGFNPKPNGLTDAVKAPKDMTGSNKNGHHPAWIASHPNYKG
jgi:hypothetical protein